MLSGFIHIPKAKNIKQPEEIDTHLKESLLSYLHGEITERHLFHLLKQQLQGNSTKLSFKIVKLLPQFTQLLDLLEEEESKAITDKKILLYVLKKLADKLCNELS